MDDQLTWIQSQRESMTQRLIEWCRINSQTFNVNGLAAMERKLFGAFLPLADAHEIISLPPAENIGADGCVIHKPLGRVLRFTKRPAAPLRVLLNIHYDTVYPAEGRFQTLRLIDDQTLNGPGVADAKGGILVMLTALTALEQHPAAKQLGWAVLLNPDEEIGSPSSANLLAETAQRNHYGLVFEPALPDGSLVGARKGSGTFTIIVRGRAAHAGRDFAAGRNAIVALAEMITRISAADHPGTIINCGKIEGGGPVNIVPDLAIGRFNVRADSTEDQKWIEALFRRETVSRVDGIHVELHGGFLSPPKPLDAASEQLMDQIIATGRELGIPLDYKPSGGTCDGNKLAAAGLPVVDSLGPVGGELHSEREYVRLDSLVDRASLIAKLLIKLATGQIHQIEKDLGAGR